MNMSRREEQMAKAETGRLRVKAFTIHGSVGRALDWGESHLQWSRCVVSLSKTLYPLLSTCST